MAIGREVAKAVQGRRRPVGDDTLLRPPLPGLGLGRELQPGGAQVEVVVAHEIGHAIDYVTTGSTTEESADDQAHAAGF